MIVKIVIFFQSYCVRYHPHPTTTTNYLIGNDDALKLVPALELNLDIAVEYIAEDELVEVTPTKVGS